MLDSTEPPVIEAGLQWIGGKAILNSVNLEDGDAPGTRLDRFLSPGPRVRRRRHLHLHRRGGPGPHGRVEAAGGHGHPRPRRRALRPRARRPDLRRAGPARCRRAWRRAGATASRPSRASAASRPSCPASHTILGLSNVSLRAQAGGPPRPQLGVPARVRGGRPRRGHRARGPHHAAEPIDEQPARGLPRPRLRPAHATATTRCRSCWPCSRASSSATVEKEDRSGWPVEERLKHRIIDGDRDGLEADLDEALRRHARPGHRQRRSCSAGMKVVGELFGSGQMQLPFVLQSAETMKAAVAYLEPHMEKADQGGKGRIVLATVKGDVHDIGKNLVDIILTNNGYEVHNLGIKVAIAEMIEKAQEVDADAIGMSGLLVKSTLIMRENLEELNRRGLSDASPCCSAAPRSPAPTSSATCGRSTTAGSSTARTPSRACAPWTGSMELKRVGRRRPRLRAGALGPGAAGSSAKPDVGASTLPSRSPEVADRQRGVHAAVPRLAGGQGHLPRRHRRLPQRDRAVPQPVAVPARAQGRERRATFKDRIRPMLRAELARGQGGRRARAPGRLRLLPGQRRRQRRRRLEGRDPHRRVDALLVPPPERASRSSASPTSSGRSSRGETDYAAFHIVTMGDGCREATAELFAADRYTDYLLLHGLGVEMAEALAELWHRRIREEWGFADEDGPSLTGAVPPAVPGRALLVGLPGLPRPRGQRQGVPSCSRPTASA